MADVMEKPSFIGSVVSGMTGFVKGTLTGGILGSLLGAGVAAAVSAATGVYAQAEWAELGVAAGEAAITGATAVGAVFASIGAVAGTMTGVIKSRETPQPSMEDIANLAKVSVVQGMAIEHQRAQVQEMSGTKWRDKYTKDQAAIAMSGQQQQIH